MNPIFAAKDTPWLRGITPARLGLLALVCILMHLNNPATLNDPFFIRAGRSLHNAGIFFIAALPMFVAIVKGAGWNAARARRPSR